MSLNWNFTGCPSWKATEEKNEDGKVRYAMHLPDGSRIPWSVTDALIWATMMVDIGWDIPKNIDEFVFRVAYYQKALGAMMSTDAKERPITSAEVRAHAGMSTNVATTTRKKFYAKVARIVEQRVAEELDADGDAAAKIAMTKWSRGR